MQNIESTNNEQERLQVVRDYLQLDYNKSQEFQDIVDLASKLCNIPVALITLLDEDVNWLKVRAGLDAEVMPRETSFCQHTILSDDLLIINDAAKDNRFKGNPLVNELPHVRFYAAAPLVISNMRLGTLCLFDNKPNNLTELQQQTLTVLSRQVTFLMKLELNKLMLQQHVKEIEAQNESLKEIARMQSHDIRQPLTSIMGLINTIKDDDYTVEKERILMLEEAANDLDTKIHAIVKHTKGLPYSI